MSQAPGDVVVIGSINMDLVASVERAPQIGETVAAVGFEYVPGGKGSNQAVAAARAGATTRMVGRLGDDEFGATLLRFLSESGVDTLHVLRTPGFPSGLALITLVRQSDNSIIVVAGSNGEISPTDIDAVAIGPNDIVITQFEIPLRAVEHSLDRARAAGARSMLNPSPARECEPELLAKADILVVNETELAWFLGEAVAVEPGPLIEGAKRLRSRSDQVIVVTLGEAGSLVLSGDSALIVPARKSDVVDTTGAGDTFAGSLAAELASGSGIADSVSYANAAASLCCETMGAGTAIPARSAVLAALDT